MTPQARVAAAIDLLDLILSGQPAEKTLTTWARKNRYAGSKDRAALRDLVFDALRTQRSAAHVGGAPSGRGIMIGQMRLQGADLDEVFSGQGYAPPPLSAAEQAACAPLDVAPEAVKLDCPDWLLPHFTASLGDKSHEVLDLLRRRAPVFVRANLARTDRAAAISALAKEDIEAVPHPLSSSAIEVTGNPRRIKHSSAYLSGLVELQDAASQAVVDVLCDALPHGTVLDYCAGGGGKALALAARDLDVTAYDADPGRMNDIPARAKRAGAAIAIDPTPSGRFDAVLCDAPCSGSGAWRRQPEAKWRLTPDALDALVATQADILQQAQRLVKPDGLLAYATCSLFRAENDDAIAGFLARNSDWLAQHQKQFTPLDGGDGFFVALLARR